MNKITCLKQQVEDGGYNESVCTGTSAVQWAQRGRSMRSGLHPLRVSIRGRVCGDGARPAATAAGYSTSVSLSWRKSAAISTDSPQAQIVHPRHQYSRNVSRNLPKFNKC